MVRLALLLCLALASEQPLAAQHSDLQQENLDAVKNVLRKNDPSLDLFHVLAKKPVDATYSVMVVEAAPAELRPGASRPTPVHRRMQIGVFLVYGRTNRVRLVLDAYPLSSMVADPELDQPTAHSAYLHLYSDYGMYCGSLKYIYDLSRPTAPLKIRYRILALTSSARQNGRLRYSASFRLGIQAREGESERHATITIEPRTGDAWPAYKIVDAPAPPAGAGETEMHIAGGQSLVVANKTPPGETHQPSGIYVVSRSGRKQFFPVPIPTAALHRKLLPDKPRPGGIQNDIGPFILDGTKVWFANSFYDGEGESGVGAVGVFDIPTRNYEMRHLPEITPWSGSAILLDGEDLWVGLMRRPEGANYGTGLLRYGTRSGAATKYPVPDLIYTLDRLGDKLYCGTSHGLYVLRGDKLTQLRFEPDEKGNLVMVSRDAVSPANGR